MHMCVYIYIHIYLHYICICVYIYLHTYILIYLHCVCVCVYPYMLSYMKEFGAFTGYGSSLVNVTDGDDVCICSNIEKNVDKCYRKTSSIDSSRKGAAHGKERVIQGRRKILFISLHIFVLFIFFFFSETEFHSCCPGWSAMQ